VQPATPLTIVTTAEDHRIAWLAALAIAIHIVESVLPSPLPGVKPGLANIVTVIVLMRYGIGSAIWVAMLRVLVGSLLLGTFLTPTFLLSLSGAICSLVALTVTRTLFGNLFSAVGFSLFAAVAHIGGQFQVAYTIFIPHPGLFNLLPILMSAAVILGIINGIIANAALVKLDSHHGCFIAEHIPNRAS